MNTLFIIAMLFLISCFVFRKKLITLLHKDPVQKTPEIESTKTGKAFCYKILAFNAKDYETTKQLEDTMELRLTKCIDGMSRRGEEPEVSFFANGFVSIFLIKYYY